MVIFSPAKADEKCTPPRKCVYPKITPPLPQFMLLAQNFTPTPYLPPSEQPHGRQKAVVAVASKLRRQVYRSLSPSRLLGSSA